jgi:N6-L-threonylcarbamoyladenine synthase
MKILGIESSCDETAAAVIENTPNGAIRLLSNITATSAGLHARTGGIIPEEAARKQIESIIPVINLALRDAFPNHKPSTVNSELLTNIDAIALTVGPGLIGSLLIGVETAKTLSMVTGKPIIPVNHLVGHIYANFISEMPNHKFQISNGIKKTNHQSLITNHLPLFPALALVVSGGHTDLVLMHDHGKFEWIGGTRDDAAGEAFDKTARLLGFDYPGGPLLSKAADEYIHSITNDVQPRPHNGGPLVGGSGAVEWQDPLKILDLFPRPLIHEKGYDWSFSGLKTAVLRTVKDLAGEEQNLKLSDYKAISKLKIIGEEQPRLAAEIQEAIVDVLVEKTLPAVAQFKPKSLVLAGGVSANQRLREKFEYRIKTQKPPISFHVPKPILCTDNAAYIAAAAYYNQQFVSWQNINANPELTIMDRV